jgi:hypothetical protein
MSSHLDVKAFRFSRRHGTAVSGCTAQRKPAWVETANELEEVKFEAGRRNGIGCGGLKGM